MTTNKLETMKQIPGGHANSCAWDSVNDVIYLAPTWDYSLTPAPVADYLYMFDRYLNYIGKETVPFAPCGVTFDPVNKVMYGKSTNISKEIYVKKNGVWELFTTVDYPKYETNTQNRTYDQDIAVYDNKVYFSSSNRSILYGIIKENNISILGAINCSNVESTNTLYLGELEGMELLEARKIIVEKFSVMK